MFTIQYVYSDNVEIIYYTNDDRKFYQRMSGTMENITEEALHYLIFYNWMGADVCSEETGEVLVTIERSLTSA